MALSALSLAHQKSASSLDAIDHYGQALPSLQATLKTDEDLDSDGALFTHFFLLLYEVRKISHHISLVYLILDRDSSFSMMPRMEPLTKFVHLALLNDVSSSSWRINSLLRSRLRLLSNGARTSGVLT